MTIGNAVQRGDWIYIYDDQGRQTACINAGSGGSDALTGFTANAVNVRRGDWIYSFDEHGSQVSTTNA